MDAVILGMFSRPEGSSAWAFEMSNSFVEEWERRRMDAFVEDYQKSPYARRGDGEPVGLIPSPIDEEMVLEHEQMLGTRLPPLFRAYLLADCLPDTDLYVGQLPPIPPARPFEWIERWSIEKMDQPFYRMNERLIPFTHGPADMSDMCFDIFRPGAGGDFPILDVRAWRPHVKVGRWSNEDCRSSQVFGKFSDYLDYLNEWLLYRTAEPGLMFKEWLRIRGNKGKFT